MSRSTNVQNPTLPVYTGGDLFNAVVATGAAGFIDTDLSAHLPTTAIAASLYVYVSGGTDIGARGPGETVDTHVPFPNSTVNSRVVGQHIELYRQAAGNNTYVLMGYWT